MSRRKVPAKETGTLLRLLRVRKGVTQRDVAVSLGVDGSTVSIWENGHRFPTEHVAALAEFYGVSLDELYSGRLRDAVTFSLEVVHDEAFSTCEGNHVRQRCEPSFEPLAGRDYQLCTGRVPRAPSLAPRV